MTLPANSSLLRRLGRFAFGDCSEWRNESDVTDDALLELDYPNGQTSIWDEGWEAARRDVIILAIALSRRAIQRLDLGALYSFDLSPELAERFRQTVGDTPVIIARNMHYELSMPIPADYREMALAFAKRGEFPCVSTTELMDRIEDALLSGVEISPLFPELQEQIDKMKAKRWISVVDLSLSESHPIFDIRLTESEAKIGDARWISRAQVLSDAALPHGVRKLDRVTIYCEDGRASQRVARTLRSNGYIWVRILLGGYEAWKGAGF